MLSMAPGTSRSNSGKWMDSDISSVELIVTGLVIDTPSSLVTKELLCVDISPAVATLMSLFQRTATSVTRTIWTAELAITYPTKSLEGRVDECFSLRRGGP